MKCDEVRVQRSDKWGPVDNIISSMLDDSEDNIVFSKHCSENIINNFSMYNNCFVRRFNLFDITKEKLSNGLAVSVDISYGKIVRALIKFPYKYQKDMYVVVAFDNFVNEKRVIKVVTAWVDNDKEGKEARRNFLKKRKKREKPRCFM